jgi:putative ubiquitin-RnfH superfamily antitoxin RatB of RatAB toxin-antitoxin module
MRSLCGLNRCMAIELVLCKPEGIEVLDVSLAQPASLAIFLGMLPEDIRADIQTLELSACRRGKLLNEESFIEATDQIAFLPKATVDPKVARRARVDKQRKEGKTAKYRAAALANRLAALKR